MLRLNRQLKECVNFEGAKLFDKNAMENMMVWSIVHEKQMAIKHTQL